MYIQLECSVIYIFQIVYTFMYVNMDEWRCWILEKRFCKCYCAIRVDEIKKNYFSTLRSRKHLPHVIRNINKILKVGDVVWINSKLKK